MKTSILFLTLIAAVSAYEAVSQPPCKEYEVHSSCGSACHPTCDTLDQEPTVCTLQCVIGCFCKDGTYRTESGSCVPEGECKKDDGCPAPKEGSE